MSASLQTISEHLIFEEQNDFRKSRSYIDNVFIITQVIEKQSEFNKVMQVAFIDFLRAFNK